MWSGKRAVTLACHSGGATFGRRELTAAQRLSNRLRARRHAQPPLRTFDVRMRRVLADLEQPPDCPVVFALGDQRETLAFTTAQDEPSTIGVRCGTDRRV